ncbi:nuclear transport factor 2 family protein [Amycolatopsis sp. GM8]|uniref:nuclear transport factor 2 family protein n=1 Tax=Amycolatopsis sp. GM8 TaxID=2896530 RepID=UPI001F3D371B|nr:nuclear transport factor 2 family protein [Amycolatopsis sp. GM8]
MADLTVEQRITQLQDRLDLQDLVHRYAQLNDYSETPEELISLFTDDAVLVGVFREPATGAAAVRSYAESIIAMRGSVPYRHHVSNILTTVDGDEAFMTAFFILVYRHAIYEGAVQLSRVHYGNFEFRARRVGDRWLISRRVVRLDPS